MVQGSYHQSLAICELGSESKQMQNEKSVHEVNMRKEDGEAINLP